MWQDRNYDEVAERLMHWFAKPARGNPLRRFESFSHRQQERDLQGAFFHFLPF